jgi:hypothetical protein
VSTFKLKGDGHFETEVVSELDYQDNFALVFGSPPAHGEALHVEAVLVSEADNPSDPNAVRVDVAGHVLGYLPRAVARRYTGYVSRLGMAASVATLADAKVFGIRREIHSVKVDYAIRLDLPAHLLTTGLLSETAKKSLKRKGETDGSQRTSARKSHR